MIPVGAIELERQALILRYAAAELLNMEMYDRWGHGSDPAMNQKMEQAGSVRAAHARAKSELPKMVNRYRKEQPEVVEFWLMHTSNCWNFFCR